MPWNCETGSCLLVPSGPAGDHLFTVALGPKRLAGYGPEEQVVIVSFTSIKAGLHHDDACEIAVGDHPFIVRESYIYYREPRIYPATMVRQKVESGEWTEREPCSEDLIRKVLEGFRKSKRLPRHFNDILDEFGM